MPMPPHDDRYAMPKRRPGCLVALVVAMWALAAAGLTAALLVAATSLRAAPGGVLIWGDLIFLLLQTVPIPLLVITAGIGLWLQRKWALWLTVILLSLGFAVALLNLTTSLMAHDSTRWLWSLVAIPPLIAALIWLVGNRSSMG